MEHIIKVTKINSGSSFIIKEQSQKEKDEAVRMIERAERASKICKQMTNSLGQIYGIRQQIEYTKRYYYRPLKVEDYEWDVIIK